MDDEDAVMAAEGLIILVLGLSGHMPDLASHAVNMLTLFPLPARTEAKQRVRTTVLTCYSRPIRERSDVLALIDLLP